jgi:hypothetical protein
MGKIKITLFVFCIGIICQSCGLFSDDECENYCSIPFYYYNNTSDTLITRRVVGEGTENYWMKPNDSLFSAISVKQKYYDYSVKQKLKIYLKNIKQGIKFYKVHNTNNFSLKYEYNPPVYEGNVDEMNFFNINYWKFRINLHNDTIPVYRVKYQK